MKKLSALVFAALVLSLFVSGCPGPEQDNEYYISFDAKGGTNCVKEGSIITLPLKSE